MSDREDRDYYNRKSLEDSMKICGYCLIALVAVSFAIVLVQLLK